MERILVIRLSALGDFVLSFRAFAAIRAHHRLAHITLLTTAPYAELARRAPWFDAVRTDARPAFWDLPGLLRLARSLRGFDRVYDLQTSGRSDRYFLLALCPPWSGTARFARFRHRGRARDHMHTIARQREQLEIAGIGEFPRPDLAWLGADVASFGLPEPFALLVPGAAPHRPAKRWPAQRYAALARLLAARGLTPVILGAAAERTLGAEIAALCPGARDLTGRTDLFALAGLAARARLAVGNDTGPMHLIAATGCPSLVLFSAESDPARTAPAGPDGRAVAVLRVPDLATLAVERVAAALP